MKKIIAVLVAGTLIIGNAVAQTAISPTEKKSTAVASQKQVEKKDAGKSQQKDASKKHHHHDGKNKGKKPESKTGDVKSPEKK